MSWLKENWFKVGLLVIALVAGVSVAYYYVIFLPQKEQAKIELQRREQLARELKEEENKEQEQKEYVAKRKQTCYDMYLQEKKQWNNVKDFAYSDVRDKCIVFYSSNERAKNKDECATIIENTATATPYLADILH